MKQDTTTTKAPTTTNRAIWRIDVEAMTKASLPKGAIFRSVRMGHGKPVMKSYWEVDPTAETEERYITALTTGEAIPPGAKFLATEILTGLHVFEIPAEFANK